MSTIRTANRILVFDKGLIVESGTHDELMKLNKLYKKLFMAQGIDKQEKEPVFEHNKKGNIFLK